jgi:Holliday junction DNA helicase RuvA
MIGRLRGILVAKQPPRLMLEVGGVAYEVEATMGAFFNLPALGHEVVLHTHLVVREDAHLLYGFASEAEKDMFRQLIKISGIGPKLALAILSGMSADELAACVADGDTARLTRLPGVGKKTAERLVVELRDRLKDWGLPAAAASGAVVPASLGPRPSDPVADAVAALEALGYKPQEAARMVSRVETQNRSPEEIIRAALQAAVRAAS